jgi:hypothetical protein
MDQKEKSTQRPSQRKKSQTDKKVGTLFLSACGHLQININHQTSLSKQIA